MQNIHLTNSKMAVFVCVRLKFKQMVLPKRNTKEENDFDIIAQLLSDRVRLLKYVNMWIQCIENVYWEWLEIFWGEHHFIELFQDN
jgi:hypothetical protein